MNNFNLNITFYFYLSSVLEIFDFYRVVLVFDLDNSWNAVLDYEK